jgi:hypothetical protein
LQSALARAAASCADEIWVARGSTTLDENRRLPLQFRRGSASTAALSAMKPAGTSEIQAKSNHPDRCGPKRNATTRLLRWAMKPAGWIYGNGGR